MKPEPRLEGRGRAFLLRIHTGSIHLARNLRTTPLVFDATFIDPAGVPPTHPRLRHHRRVLANVVLRAPGGSHG
jgi:hypothetical protein